MFKLFRGKGDGDKPTLPEILKLTIGRTALIDEIALKLIPDDSLLDVPSATLPIVAQGTADMGEGVTLHRFYPDDDSVLLQVLGGDGREDQTVQEITLFFVLDAYYPSADADFEAWRERIRQTSFDLNGTNFQRAWFDNSDKPEDPVSFWEDVFDDRSAATSRRIYQTCMLFVRRIGSFDEFLLVNMEEPEGAGDRCVSLMVGVPLSPNAIDV